MTRSSKVNTFLTTKASPAGHVGTYVRTYVKCLWHQTFFVLTKVIAI